MIAKNKNKVDKEFAKIIEYLVIPNRNHVLHVTWTNYKVKLICFYFAIYMHFYIFLQNVPIFSFINIDWPLIKLVNTWLTLRPFFMTLVNWFFVSLDLDINTRIFGQKLSCYAKCLSSFQFQVVCIKEQCFSEIVINVRKQTLCLQKHQFMKE